MVYEGDYKDYGGLGRIFRRVPRTYNVIEGIVISEAEGLGVANLESAFQYHGMGFTTSGVGIREIENIEMRTLGF